MQLSFNMVITDVVISNTVITSLRISPILPSPPALMPDTSAPTPAGDFISHESLLTFSVVSTLFLNMLINLKTTGACITADIIIYTV
jgi:hypothetical protein